MKKIFILSSLIVFSLITAAQVITLKHNGIERKCLLHIPNEVSNKSNSPLLIYLHGNSTDPKDYAEITKYNYQANIIGFMVAYPYAIDLSWSTGPGKKDSIVDDVGFISMLIKELNSKYNIDTNQVYISGHSQGAYMTYRLGVELPNKLAGIAPLAGTISEQLLSKLQRPVKLVHTHAIDDDYCPFKGNEYSLSIEKIVEKWKTVNNCMDSALITLMDGLVVKNWKSSTGQDVYLNLYSKGRHSWPYDPVNASELICKAFFNFSSEGYIFEINYPKNDAILSPENAKINVNIPEGSKIVKMGYFNDKQLIAESDKPPFSVDLSSLEVGKYFITAKAFDADEHLMNFKQFRFYIVQPYFNIEVEAKTSSEQDENTFAQCAVDGNLYTRWSSTFNDNEWISLDFKEDKTINGITIFWEIAYAANYKVQISDDTFNWNNIIEETNSDGNIDYIKFEKVKTKYLRILCEKRATNWGNSIWEIKLHNID